MLRLRLCAQLGKQQRAIPEDGRVVLAVHPLDEVDLLRLHARLPTDRRTHASRLGVLLLGDMTWTWLVVGWGGGAARTLG
mgnify:CR=1 FL=1